MQAELLGRQEVQKGKRTAEGWPPSSGGSPRMPCSFQRSSASSNCLLLPQTNFSLRGSSMTGGWFPVVPMSRGSSFFLSSFFSFLCCLCLQSVQKRWAPRDPYSWGRSMTLDNMSGAGCWACCADGPASCLMSQVGLNVDKQVETSFGEKPENVRDARCSGKQWPGCSRGGSAGRASRGAPSRGSPNVTPSLLLRCLQAEHSSVYNQRAATSGVDFSPLSKVESQVSNVKGSSPL